MKKNIRYGLLGLLAVAVVALTGGSFYMLGYSLTPKDNKGKDIPGSYEYMPVSYTHLRAHETGRNLVCRLLLEKKKKKNSKKKKKRDSRNRVNSKCKSCEERYIVAEL